MIADISSPPTHQLADIASSYYSIKGPLQSRPSNSTHSTYVLSYGLHLSFLCFFLRKIDAFDLSAVRARALLRCAKQFCICLVATATMVKITHLANSQDSFVAKCIRMYLFLHQYTYIYTHAAISFQFCGTFMDGFIIFIFFGKAFRVVEKMWKYLKEMHYISR